MPQAPNESADIGRQRGRATPTEHINRDEASNRASRTRHEHCHWPAGHGKGTAMLRRPSRKTESKEKGLGHVRPKLSRTCSHCYVKSQ
eukprot:2633024-Pleurochrysis_carterae.AAC.1